MGTEHAITRRAAAGVLCIAELTQFLDEVGKASEGHYPESLKPKVRAGFSGGIKTISVTIPGGGDKAVSEFGQAAAMTGVERTIRRARTIRAIAAPAAALGALLLAATLIAGSPLVPVLASVLASAQAACIAILQVLIVTQTRQIGTLRRRERELNRPHMTPEDYRRLREMEIELGWEPSEVPATVAAPAQPVRSFAEQAKAVEDSFKLAASGSVSMASLLSGTGSLSAKARLTDGEVKDATEAALHFAQLARVGRDHCIGFCPICAERSEQR
jgi:hypothetical protein